VTVRTFATALALAAAAAGCDALPGRPTAADRPVLMQNVTSFESLWSLRCAGCHGADGRLGAAQPMADPLYLALVPRADLRRVVAEGVPGTAMPGFGAAGGGDLTDAQVDIVVDGMRERWGGAPPGGTILPAWAAPPGDPTRGQTAFATYCARCHADGPGGVLDPAYVGLVSDQALRTAVICGRNDLGMPDWRGYVAGRPMSAREIADVVGWLASHRRPPPEKEANDG
jgi:mono/diheme cytochrome c family protein